MLNIFGGRGSATYNSGTDGGTTGTGRADQAMIYRNDIGAFSFGLQLQARSTTNNYFIDGYGISASYNLTKELKIGTAYMKSLINDDFIENEALLGLDDNPSYFTAGISYASEKLIVSGIFAIQSNGDLFQTIVEQADSTFDSATVIFDATGFELYAKYRLKEFNIIAGFNSYFPDVQKFEDVDGLVLIDDGFKTEQFILGLEYIPTKFTCIYAEGRIANGKGPLGIPISDVVAAGLRIDLEKLFTDKRLLN